MPKAVCAKRRWLALESRQTKLFPIEALIPESSVEALNEAILI